MLRSTEFERKEGKYFKRVKEEYWKYSDGGKYRKKFETKSEVQRKGCMEAHRDVQNYNRWDESMDVSMEGKMDGLKGRIKVQ